MPKSLGVRIGLLLAVSAVTAACSGGAAPDDGDDGSAGILTIDSHQDGDVIATDSVQLRGTAPANAEIVQDIGFAADRRTTADGNGEWVLTVDLDEGDNDITMRIGPDDATSKTIRLVYEPETAAEETPSADDASAEPTSSPKPREEASPEPTPEVITFGSGDLIVGEDVRPGTYRTRETSSLCYWERLSGFSGDLDDIIANGTGSGYHVVTIGKRDAGFSSDGCATWSADLSRVTRRRNAPVTEDGTYIVGTDIAPGTWRSEGGSGFGCYAARLSGFGGTLDHIIVNDLASEGGLIMTVAASDAGSLVEGRGAEQRHSVIV